METSVPFDQSMPASLIYKDDMPYLEQDGRLYSNAVYNRRLGRWEPDPQPVDLPEENMLLLYQAVIFQIEQTARHVQETSIAMAEALEQGERAYIAALDRRIEDLEAQVEERNSQVAMLRQENEEVYSRLDALTERYNELVRDMKPDELAALEEQVRAMKAA